MKKKHYIWAAFCVAAILVVVFYPSKQFVFKNQEIGQKENKIAGEQNPANTQDGKSEASGWGRVSEGDRSSSMGEVSPKKPNAENPAETVNPLFPPIPEPDPAVVAAQELENDVFRRDAAEALRQSGLSEEEIERQVEGFFPPPDPEITDPGGEEAVEVTPDQLALDAEFALMEAGVPEEEIGKMVESFLHSIQQNGQLKTPPFPAHDAH